MNDSFGKDGNIVHSLAINSPELASRIVQALFETEVDLAEFIQDALMSKESLSKADVNHARSTTPLVVDREQLLVSPEILGWSLTLVEVSSKCCLHLVVTCYPQYVGVNSRLQKMFNPTIND